MNRSSDQDHPHRQRIRRHYEHRISPERPNYEILDWASPQSQQARFEILVQNLDLAGKSLLDVGCGLGDLLTYLQKKQIPVDYTGVDIVEKMIEAARLRHPEGRFLQADIFAQSPFEAESFDVTFCSGAFNLNLGNNEQFLPRAVAEMVRLARNAAVFNLLHHRAAAQESTYFYYDPARVPQLVAGLGVQTRIIDDYLHNDFTVICTKNR